MATQQILDLLVSERDKIDRAISALSGTATSSGSLHSGMVGRSRDVLRSAPGMPPPQKHGRIFTPAQKARQAQRMRDYWTKRKKATAKAAPAPKAAARAKAK